jgi:hypothetical protein
MEFSNINRILLPNLKKSSLPIFGFHNAQESYDIFDSDIFLCLYYAFLSQSEKNNREIYYKF